MADVLDDELLISIENAWRGVNNRQHPTQLEKGFAVDITNGIVDEIGLIRSRPGLTAVGDDGGSARILGLAEFNPHGGTHVLLRVFGSTLQIWTGSGNWTGVTLAFTPTSDLITNIVVANNRAFLLNGTDNAQSYDGSTVTDEGNMNSSVPRGTIGEWIINRLFVAGVMGSESSLFYSNSLDPQAFNRSNNFKSINTGDNYKITALKKFREFELLVFKKVGIYVLDVQDPTPGNWVPTPVDTRFGCVAGRTVLQVGVDIWFLSNDGHIRSIRRNEQNKLTGADVPMSREIQDWVDDINKAHMHKSCAAYFNNKAYFFVPTGTSQRPDKAYVYDFLTQGWTRELNRNILSVAISDIESGVERLYGGESQADSVVYRVDVETATSDVGTSIPVTVDTRRDDMEAPLVDKVFMFGEVEFEATGGTATVSAQVDGAGYTVLGTVDLVGGGVALPATLPMIFPSEFLKRGKFDLQQLGRGRDIQYRVEYDDADNAMRLQRVMTAAIAQNIERD
jgi:hypothetical protein